MTGNSDSQWRGITFPIVSARSPLWRWLHTLKAEKGGAWGRQKEYGRKNTKEKSNGFKYFSIEEGCSRLKGIIVSIKKNTPLKIKKYLKNNGIVYFEECSLKIDDILEEVPNKKIIKEGDIFTDIASEIIKAVEEN